MLSKLEIYFDYSLISQYVNILCFSVKTPSRSQNSVQTLVSRNMICVYARRLLNYRSLLRRIRIIANDVRRRSSEGTEHK